jgi:hypothetical protein
MAVKTHFVFIEILDLLRSVLSFLQIAHDLFVADQTVVRLKTILGSFGYFFRIGVKPLFPNVLMAILAGGLSMNGSMEFLGVDPPGGMGVPGQPQKKGNKKNDRKKRFLSSPRLVRFLGNHKGFRKSGFRKAGLG